jgi:hypothetical protein
MYTEPVNNLTINAKSKIKLKYGFYCGRVELKCDWQLNAMNVEIESNGSPITLQMGQVKCKTIDIDNSISSFAALECKTLKMREPTAKYIDYIKQFNIPQYTISGRVKGDLVFDNVMLRFINVTTNELDISNSLGVKMEGWNEIKHLKVSNTKKMYAHRLNSKETTIQGKTVNIENSNIELLSIDANELTLSNTELKKINMLKVSGTLTIKDCTINDSIIEMVKNCGAKNIDWEIK